MADLTREERAAAVAAGRAAYDRWRSIPNRDAYLDMWFAAAGAEGAQAVAAMRAVPVSDTPPARTAHCICSHNFPTPSRHSAACDAERAGSAPVEPVPAVPEEKRDA